MGRSSGEEDGNGTLRSVFCSMSGREAEETVIDRFRLGEDRDDNSSTDERVAIALYEYDSSKSSAGLLSFSTALYQVGGGIEKEESGKYTTFRVPGEESYAAARFLKVKRFFFGAVSGVYKFTLSATAYYNDCNFLVYKNGNVHIRLFSYDGRSSYKSFSRSFARSLEEGDEVRLSQPKNHLCIAYFFTRSG